MTVILLDFYKLLFLMGFLQANISYGTSFTGHHEKKRHYYDEPVSRITYKFECAYSEDSNQFAHTRNLSRVLVFVLKKR